MRGRPRCHCASRNALADLLCTATPSHTSQGHGPPCWGVQRLVRPAQLQLQAGGTLPRLAQCRLLVRDWAVWSTPAPVCAACSSSAAGWRSCMQRATCVLQRHMCDYKGPVHLPVPGWCCFPNPERQSRPQSHPGQRWMLPRMPVTSPEPQPEAARSAQQHGQSHCHACCRST